MPVARMRMRPWLEKMINSNTVNGLSWLDKEKTMFSIPWKHAARHGWELSKDACLFKEWAIHTGKYKEGQACDPKTWKANFRCAMNSLNDIEEVKTRSINKGHQAVRVFRMLPPTPKCKDKQRKVREKKQRKKSSVVKMEEDTDYSDTQSPVNASTQENTIDSTVAPETDGMSFVDSPEVPDWSQFIEIEPSSFSNTFPPKFEVSPDHSPTPDYCQDIIEICEQLEKEPQWTYSAGCNGFLGNEVCTSPGSQWSETSSAEDLEDIPHYTTLGTDADLSTATDDFWSNFSSPMLPLL